jgi:hypothetical protein
VLPQWFHRQRRVQRRIQHQQQQQQTAGAVVSAPDISRATVPGRVGKKPDLKKKQPSGFFGFLVFFFFFCFFGFFYILGQKREFLGFFSLNYYHSY